jgi:subtilisin-like proprotein convertase family protein
MKIIKLRSRVALATMGLLAAGTGVVALTSTPAQALSTSCQRTNDTDVALARGWTVESAVNIPTSCFAGVGSHVRVDVHIKNGINGDNRIVVVQPNRVSREVKGYDLDSASGLLESYRWTTYDQSSAGTWKLQVTNVSLYGAQGAYIDYWSVTVIMPSCWRYNFDDVTSAPSIPVSTSVSVSSACTGKADPRMFMFVQLQNADEGGYDLRLFRNGVEVPITGRFEDGDRNSRAVTLTANGSQLDAAGTWKLQLTTPKGKDSVTMDSWGLHTSF